MGVDAAQMLVTIGCRLDGLDAGLAQMDRKMGAAAKKADHHAGRMSGAFSRAFKNVAAYGGLATVGVAIGAVARNSMNLEKTLSTLGAVSKASGRDMQAFKAAAVEASLKTKFSSVDAAQAMVELAKGGVKVSQIKGALQGTLAMAAAGGIDVADAANAAANAMNLFGISGKHTTHVADAFATAANSTTANIGDFAMALSQGGGVAKMAGLSFDETVVSLEALAKSGIKNSDAGTSLKNSILALLTPSKQQAKIMKDYGLSFIKSNGKVKDAAETADMLRDKLGGLTKAQRLTVLSQIAGSDGVRALGAMYDAGGKQIRGWSKELDKSGTAAAQAAKMQDNTAAKLQKLEHSALAAGGVFVDAFIPGLQHGADAVSKFLADTNRSGDLDRFASKAEHAAEAGIGALTSAAHTAAPALGALHNVVNSIGTGPLLAGLASFKIGGALAGDLGGLSSKFKAARAGGAGVGKSFASMAGGANLAALGIAALAGGLVYLSGRQSDVTRTANEAAAAILGLVDAENNAKDSAHGYTDAKQRVKDANVGLERAEKNYSDTVKRSGKNSLDARESHLQLEHAQIEQKRAVKDLDAAQMKHTNDQIKVTNQNAAVTQSIVDVAMATDEAGRRATVAAGARGAALTGSAKAIQAAKGEAQALRSAGDAFRSLAGSAQETNPSLAGAARALGNYVDVTHTVPDSKTTRLFLVGAARAVGDLDSVYSWLAKIKDKRVQVQITTAIIGSPSTSGHGGSGGKNKDGSIDLDHNPKTPAARGGISRRGRVFGGFGGQDSVSAILKPGEDVVNGYERNLMRAGVPYDEAMSRGGAVALAKGGKAREPRSLDTFLGNSLLMRISRANATLSTADDRSAAKAAANQLTGILKHKKWHGKSIMGAERREMLDALGGYRQTALKPDRGADDFLSSKTKAALALAHSTNLDQADDRVAAGNAVTDLQNALKGKVSAEERNAINEALGGYRSDAAAPTDSSSSDSGTEFSDARTAQRNVAAGLGRALQYLGQDTSDIGDGTFVVNKLVIAPTSGNMATLANGSNSGNATSNRTRLYSARERVA